MRSKTYTLLSLLLHPVHTVRDRSVIVFSRLRGTKGCLSIDDSVVKKSTISIMGTGNTVSLDNCEVYNSSIILSGSNNRIHISKGTKIFNMRIEIRKTADGFIEIGEHSSFGGGHIVSKGKCNSITIGDNCMFAEDVEVWNADTHNILKEDVVINKAAPVVVGNHVWIGKGASVLKGVHIGDGSVVGMNSLVTKDMPSNCVCTGIPARVIHENIRWTK